VGSLFRVEEDCAGSSVDLDDFSILMSSGLAPSVSDRRFHRQMVYAVCSSVYASFRAALGRNVAWGFDDTRGGPRLLNEFGLVSQDEARRRAIQAEAPCVQSIRSSRRIGPNGQIVFDLVGEVTQRQLVSFDGRRMVFYGGSTIILGPEGELRYVVSKSLVSRTRLDKQIEFVSSDVGKGFWEETTVGFVQRPDIFRLLHHL
jgi:hypothetical protein